MNDYTPKAPHVSRWYLTEWEQHERLEYRRKVHAAAACIGGLVGLVGGVFFARALGM